MDPRPAAEASPTLLLTHTPAAAWNAACTLCALTKLPCPNTNEAASNRLPTTRNHRPKRHRRCPL